MLRVSPAQNCFPQGWSCSGLPSSGLVLCRAASLGLVLFRAALFRAGPVQDCSPQASFFRCQRVRYSGLVLFRTVLPRLVSFRAALLRAGAVHGCSPQAVGLQLGLAMTAFRKPFGTANGSIGSHLGSYLGQKWLYLERPNGSK